MLIRVWPAVNSEQTYFERSVIATIIQAIDLDIFTSEDFFKCPSTA